VISFTSRPLYTHGKIPQYPLGRRLCGPHKLCGRSGLKKFPDPAENQIPVVQRETSSLYWLNYHIQNKFYVLIQHFTEVWKEMVKCKNHAMGGGGEVDLNLHAFLAASKWRWMSRPLYSRRLRYPLGTRLGVSYSQSGCSGEEKFLAPCPCR